MSSTQIIWFRQDLRLEDQAAVHAAALRGPVIGLYIWDEESGGDWAMGSASKYWLHHSLNALKIRFEALGGVFILKRGPMVEMLVQVAMQVQASDIHATRHFEPWHRNAERRAKTALDQITVKLHLHPNSWIYEPDIVLKDDNTPYKVFTPFWKALLSKGQPPHPLISPERLNAPTKVTGPSDAIEDWNLLPRNPDWAQHWPALWQPGEYGAHQRLNAFLQIAGQYSKERDRADCNVTSKLSPHLHFGEISAHFIWHTLLYVNDQQQVEPFLRQLAWRDFFNQLLYFFPNIAESCWKSRYEDFPWVWDHPHLTQWKFGQTGFPVIDAGMRQLWQTGWMHNRVRMIVASFLTKNMQVHWRVGEQWFWETLVDADLANNAGGWQWIAGSGADAQPFFRIFNPVSQAEKFDPQGTYVRQYVPELKHLSPTYIHHPWNTDPRILKKAGIILGKTYPFPILDLKTSRQSALNAHQKF